MALDPKDVVSIGNLGNALRKQKKPEEAIITYKKALAANPDNVDILNNLAVAYRGVGRNAARLGKQPIARIVAQAVSGVEPKWVMMAPVEAVEKLLKKTWIPRRKQELAEN